MDEETYRAALITASGGKSSTREMTVPELERVMAHMKRVGFKVRTPAKTRGGAAPSKRAAPSRTLAHDPESKKIRALWLLLHALGAVRNPSEAALAAYVKRITGVDDLHWISSGQAKTLIETLKKWALRFLPAHVQQLSQQLADELNRGCVHLKAETVQELNSLIASAQQRHTFDPIWQAWDGLTTALNIGRRNDKF